MTVETTGFRNPRPFFDLENSCQRVPAETTKKKIRISIREGKCYGRESWVKKLLHISSLHSIREETGVKAEARAFAMIHR